MDQMRCLRQPAQLHPGHATEAAEAELQAGSIGLLRLLETAWDELSAQIPQHSPEAGEIHQLQARRRHQLAFRGLPTLLADANAGHERQPWWPHRDHRSQWS